MKIYNRADFLNLPEGTLFCKGQPWTWESLSVKGETRHGEYSDFWFRDLCWIDSEGSHVHFDEMQEMLETGRSIPMNDDIQRDGCYDDKDIFLVFDKGDLLSLKTIIEEALKVA